LHGLQSRKAVPIGIYHQVTVFIFTGRDFSLGVTERAKQEFFLYTRRRIQPAPSGGFVLPKYEPVLPRLGFVLPKYKLVLPRLGFVLLKYEPVLPRLGFVLPKYKLVLPRLGFVLPKYGPVLPRLSFVLPKYGLDCARRRLEPAPSGGY
jgi:hypothetical protein